jgi:hypothetical protein
MLYKLCHAVIRTETSGALPFSFLFQLVCIFSYWFDTWCVTVRKELTLKVSVNRELRNVFGPKREEITGGWTELHNMEHHHILLK